MRRVRCTEGSTRARTCKSDGDAVRGSGWSFSIIIIKTRTRGANPFNPRRRACPRPRRGRQLLPIVHTADVFITRNNNNTTRVRPSLLLTYLPRDDNCNGMIRNGPAPHQTSSRLGAVRVTDVTSLFRKRPLRKGPRKRVADEMFCDTDSSCDRRVLDSLHFRVERNVPLVFVFRRHGFRRREKLMYSYELGSPTFKLCGTMFFMPKPRVGFELAHEPCWSLLNCYLPNG